MRCAVLAQFGLYSREAGCGSDAAPRGLALSPQPERRFWQPAVTQKIERAIYRCEKRSTPGAVAEGDT